jgi:hypothetical protein
MSQTSNPYHFIRIWLRSMEEPLVFEVAEAAWGRFRRSYQTKKTGFFIFATRDGRTLALNLDYVLCAEVWEEAGRHLLPAPERSSQVTLYYLEGISQSFKAQDPVDLADIFSALKLGQKEHNLTFVAADGKFVIFSISNLLLLEAATDFVEEGYKQIYYRERGTLPPS